MQSTVAGIDRQPQASAGNASQGVLPLLGLVTGPQLLPSEVVARGSFSGMLVEAARHSGLDDQDIAEAMNICAGYMSRFMRGVAQQWAKRLVMFMRITGSLAPLQWLADQVGCDIVPRAVSAARIRELEAELLSLRRGGVAA